MSASGKRPAPEPWYRDGLRFGCTGCGACCTIEGHVWVDRRQIRRLARHLDLTVEAFGRKYLRRIGSRYSLTEVSLPGNAAKKACVFWNGKCTVYEARPTQCRTFPFWKETVKTPASWAQAGELSPGIGTGRLYQIGEIERLLDRRGATSEGEPGAVG
ncbi:MAG: YkgJ family cysteine cluster protein [Acidobacteriota bacterium]|nr:YkgJ family cysteine cluster protein [Acidobacteriota bacterium]